jgi:PAS domain S-box-containing protein
VDDDLLKESLHDLYERAPCGYLFTRPDGTIVRVNQTFLDWTGYARDALLASTRFQDLLTVPGRIFYENQFAPLLRLQGAVREVAFDLVRDGREPLPVLVNAVLRAGADGQPLLVASAIFDATQRRTYERELLLARRRTEQLAAVVTASGDAILSASVAGRVQTWNAGAERLFGLSAAEIVGRSLQRILPLLGDAATWERLLDGLREGRTAQLEAEGRRADGTRVDVSVGLTPHPGPLGELSEVAAIIRDVSDRRALERLQQEFLAMASHELRNPLAAISGHAQLMRRRGQYSAASIEAIVGQAEQLSRLVDDLLLASQLEADRLELRLAETDLVAEVRAAAAAHGRADAAPVRVDAPAEPLTVQADRERLGQVLANLLTNAAKYAPAAAGTVVRVERAADGARIAVIDRGAGIPPEALPHLFDRFYRVAAGARQAQGLGLGLYITRRIVEAHGGRISVESRVGQGSTFTVTLPLPAAPGGQE